MTSEFSIHELNCAIRQQNKTRKPQGRRAFPIRWSTILEVWLNRNCWTYTTRPGTQGHFQTSWKEAIIIPILKKGKDRQSKTSYHPISLLKCLGKTMECIVNRRLQHHLEKNGLFSPSQSGFRRTGAQRTKWHCLPRILRMASSRRWRHWLSLSTSPRLSTTYGRRDFSSSF